MIGQPLNTGRSRGHRPRSTDTLDAARARADTGRWSHRAHWTAFRSTKQLFAVQPGRALTDIIAAIAGLAPRRIDLSAGVTDEIIGARPAARLAQMWHRPAHVVLPADQALPPVAVDLEAGLPAPRERHTAVLLLVAGVAIRAQVVGARLTRPRHRRAYLIDVAVQPLRASVDAAIAGQPRGRGHAGVDAHTADRSWSHADQTRRAVAGIAVPVGYPGTARQPGDRRWRSCTRRTLFPRWRSRTDAAPRTPAASGTSQGRTPARGSCRRGPGSSPRPRTRPVTTRHGWTASATMHASRSGKGHSSPSRRRRTARSARGSVRCHPGGPRMRSGPAEAARGAGRSRLGGRPRSWQPPGGAAPGHRE